MENQITTSCGMHRVVCDGEAVMQKELQAHLGVLCTKANTFLIPDLPPGSGLPQPSAHSMKFKTLPICPLHFRLGRRTRPCQMQSPCCVRSCVRGWKRSWCSPGSSCPYRAQESQGAAVTSQAQQAGEQSTIPAVPLVFPELLLQFSSLNSAADKSEGTCL